MRVFTGNRDEATTLLDRLAPRSLVRYLVLPLLLTHAGQSLHVMRAGVESSGVNRIWTDISAGTQNGPLPGAKPYTSRTLVVQKLHWKMCRKKSMILSACLSLLPLLLPLFCRSSHLSPLQLQRENARRVFPLRLPACLPACPGSPLQKTKEWKGNFFARSSTQGQDRIARERGRKEGQRREV